MEEHRRADERIADLVAQEYDAFGAAYVLVARRGRLSCLAQAATGPGQP